MFTPEVVEAAIEQLLTKRYVKLHQDHNEPRIFLTEKGIYKALYFLCLFCEFTEDEVDGVMSREIEAMTRASIAISE